MRVRHRRRRRRRHRRSRVARCDRLTSTDTDGQALISRACYGNVPDPSARPALRLRPMPWPRVASGHGTECCGGMASRRRGLARVREQIQHWRRSVIGSVGGRDLVARRGTPRRLFRDDAWSPTTTTTTQQVGLSNPSRNSCSFVHVDLDETGAGPEFSNVHATY